MPRNGRPPPNPEIQMSRKIDVLQLLNLFQSIKKYNWNSTDRLNLFRPRAQIPMGCRLFQRVLQPVGRDRSE